MLDGSLGEEEGTLLLVGEGRPPGTERLCSFGSGSCALR